MPSFGIARPLAGLFAGAAAMNAVMAMTGAVSSIAVGGDIGAGWASVPNALSVTGTGVGALLLTMIMRRIGRLRGLRLGYVIAVGGTLLAATTALVDLRNAVGLMIAALLIGPGNAAAQLSRYAAAELAPERHHGLALSLLVWAGAFGAVLGPLTIGPASRLSVRAGGSELAGPFMIALAAAALAAAVLSIMARVRHRNDRSGSVAPMSIRILLTAPFARAPLAVMIVAQSVMALIMTALPPAMHAGGSDLGMVGMVLSAHTAGMFVLSPVTGRLVDRFGTRRVMVAGLLLLGGAASLAALSYGFGLPTTTAMFLLGYGWNLCFVGGSTEILAKLPTEVRLGLEGAVDAAIWGFAAIATLLSTMVMAATGFRGLALIAGLIIPLPVAGVLLSWWHDNAAERMARYPGAPARRWQSWR